MRRSNHHPMYEGSDPNHNSAINGATLGAIQVSTGRCRIGNYNISDYLKKGKLFSALMT